MAEIVNLRMARKARARAAGTAQADANRAKHGRSKAERRTSEAEAARLARTVDGAKREKDD
ncbi:MAG TPA: DUF4169 family protein [Novosphingobium sp.]|nr:DUF4169 family protein [Novosphingobium sp.]